MKIIANKPGQLGNRLFVFSHWIAYAITNNETILNPSFDEYAQYFKGTYNQNISKFPNTSTKILPKSKHKLVFTFCYFFARILHHFKIKNKLFTYIYLDWNEQLNLEDIQHLKSKYIFVQGWLFRSKQWDTKHKAAILDYFNLIDPYRNNVDTFIEGVRKQYGKIIGVHIRHGDYKTFEGGKYFYTFEEYKNYMADLYRQLKGKNPVFVICSNVKINLSDFDGLPCVNGPGHFVEDMYVFSKCDYLIGPPSTFTKWAAYYGDVPLYFIKNLKEVPSISDIV